MDFLGNPACVIYTVLKICEQDGIFNDPETLQPIPNILDKLIKNINHYANKCPLIVSNYELIFRNDRAKRDDYRSKKIPIHIITEFHKKYITDLSNPPPVPEYIYSTPEELSALNTLLKQGNARSRTFRRKNRKQRKQSRKQKQVKRK